MSSFRRYLGIGVVGLVIIAVVAVVMMQTSERQRQGGTGGPGGGRFRSTSGEPVPTLAASAHTTDVPVYLDGVGTTRALNTVTVLPQVDGKLISVNFKEGQDVERGFLLAKIDPTLYQAQYDQAVAKKAQDEALLANAKLDLVRYEKLAATNAGATQQADTQKALVAQYEAQVRADQAAIDNAKGTLDYTDITSPIAGRTGIRLVDSGNVVHPSSSTGLVVITQLRPISILFTLPQQQLGQVNQAFAKGPLTVEAYDASSRSIVDRGTLTVVDNQIDQATGTIKLKAEFPNPDLQLWPGQFVNVRVLVDTLKQVVVVPTAAVQRGPNGTFVFVVRDDNTVAMRPVTISQQDETQTVVVSGVQSGERVVTTGFTQLAEGTRVTVGTSDSGTASPGSAPAAPRSGNGERPRRQRDDSSMQTDPPRNGQQRSEREETSRTP